MRRWSRSVRCAGRSESPHRQAPWRTSARLPTSRKLAASNDAGLGASLVVVLILGFVLLPVFVVTLAAFNERAILSFPPAGWSWRWFAKALAYEDFQIGLRNGLIVTTCASS